MRWTRSFRVELRLRTQRSAIDRRTPCIKLLSRVDPDAQSGFGFPGKFLQAGSVVTDAHPKRPTLTIPRSPCYGVLAHAGERGRGSMRCTSSGGWTDRSGERSGVRTRLAGNGLSTYVPLRCGRSRKKRCWHPTPRCSGRIAHRSRRKLGASSRATVARSRNHPRPTCQPVVFFAFAGCSLRSFRPA